MKNEYAADSLAFAGREYFYYPLAQLQTRYEVDLDGLPYSIRLLLENAIRNFDGETITTESVANLAHWSPEASNHGTISFMPGRILLQDLTGVPLVVDLASLRSAAVRSGKDPDQINPIIPVDLVIDHSIQVDFAGTNRSYSQNSELEYQRNAERYQFLKWAQGSIRNFRVIPPSSGIVHQVNLEYLANVAMTTEKAGKTVVYPDTVFGTDSHTTMVNGLGVLGWGVGGIEATAAMLGQPVETLIPDVVGVHVTGKLKEGSSPTDIVLTLTHLLRKVGVVNKIVEFYGPGLDELSVPDRAMLSNMAPEYGATAAYFPVDDEALGYLRLTGRSEELVKLVEGYYKAQGLFRTKGTHTPLYSQTVEFPLDSVLPSLAGPKRPQDRVPLDQVAINFTSVLTAPHDQGGYAVPSSSLDQQTPIFLDEKNVSLEHGSVVIAAITSCTNTSNPFALISAGLLARNAVDHGLSVKPYVKTSLAPGSKAVMDYLARAGLVVPLEKLGFFLAGYGCTTCIGNSGPLHPEITNAIQENHIVAASVISGNRNFEGRVHPCVQANYLASPALVVAYALAGNFNVDLTSSPIGFSMDGNPIFLRDIWPSNREVHEVMDSVITPDVYQNAYAHIVAGDEHWRSINAASSTLYHWNEPSTYIKESPFCSLPVDPKPAIHNGRILAIFGDSVTTDHISPAGMIAMNSPAAIYLAGKGIAVSDFNTYGSRRGYHEVMLRGTFANIRIKNLMLPGVEGGYTSFQPSGERMTIFDAATRYQQAGIPLVVMAGREYGTGSSRDWAAKGPLLLGVKAVIAESFERIHRSNLVGMGILPLNFLPGENVASLELDGSEEITLSNLDQLTPGETIRVTARKMDGSKLHFDVNVMINSAAEINVWKQGGILKSFSSG